MSSGGPLKQKAIEVELDVTTFGDQFSSGEGTKVITGLACRVSIQKAGLPSLCRSTVEIWGMKQDDIATITTLSHENYKLQLKKMTVKAGNAGESLEVAFKGEIFLAYGIYDSPDIGVHIEAMNGVYQSVVPKGQYSKKGQVSGKTLIQEWADEMSWKFEDNQAPDVMLTDPVFTGSPLEKAEQCARAMDLQLIAEDEKMILSPWYLGRQGATMECSKDTGMIGYPYFDPNGIRFRHEYNSKFLLGGTANVQSIVPKATGEWKIVKVEHELEAWGAGAAWDSSLWCVYPMGK